MSTPLLDSLDHSCFHSRRIVKHLIPDLHHCMSPDCPGCIAEDVAHRAGFVDEQGEVICPHVRKDGTRCGGATHPSGQRTIVEVHAHMCVDETIHYPEMRKAGTVTEEQYQAWFATLTREEQMGYYKRVPDVHLTVQLRDDEAGLLENDMVTFEAIAHDRLREHAERLLLHQVPHRRKITTNTF